MNFFTEVRKCDVCRREREVGVASSTLGAVSFAFCKECLEHRAEPAGMFEFTLEEVGEHFVAPWVKSLNTFMDGEYLSWDEWVKKHKEKQA
jgi:hypothetical protein